MSSKKSLAARLLTRAFRTRPAAPIVRPTSPVGGRIEELEDRAVPASYNWDAGANTLALSLGASEYLTVSPSGSDFTFAVGSGTFGQTGVSTATGNGTNTITIPAADLTSSVVVATASGVTFTGAGTLTTATLSVSASFDITLHTGFSTASSSSASLVSSLYVTIGGGTQVMGTGSGTVLIQGNLGDTNTLSVLAGVTVIGTVGAASGTVTVEGRGSRFNGIRDSQRGVYVLGGTIGSGATGTVTVRGFGGDTEGSGNDGVEVENGSITSGGGNVVVEGTGSVEPTSQAGRAVEVGFNGTITAGGSGSVSVTGTGNLSRTSGVAVTSSGTITSTNGNVTVTGTGGGSGAVTSMRGVTVFAGGTITAGGSGTVTVTGTGGPTTGANNHGVLVSGVNARIRSSGGSVTVQGTGTGSSLLGVQVSTDGLISNPTGPVTVLADSIDLVSTSSVTAGGAVQLAPRTAGWSVNLGAADTVSSLGLTDTELDSVTAGTLVVGSTGIGGMGVSAAITRPAATAVELVSGGFISFNPGSVNTAGGTLKLRAASSGVQPGNTGTDVTASTTSFVAGSNFAVFIGGTGPNTNHQVLTAAGAVDLTGANLLLNGSYVPVTGNTFPIVSATSLTGTFNGLPNGAILPTLFNGQQLRINYTATGATLSLAANLSTALVAGVLTVTDTDAAGAANILSATVSGTDLVLTDTTQEFTAGVGMLSNGNKTLTIPLTSVTSLVLNTAGGNDTVTLNYTAGFLPNVNFDGGAGGNDLLNVIGGGVRSATYSPSPASTLVNKQGSVQVTGGGSSLVTFSNLEPVNVSGMMTASLATLPPPATPLAATNVFTIANGTESGNPGQLAIVVSGTTGGSPIETVHFFDNTTVVIDTSGVAGSVDTFTVSGANATAAGITNLTLATGSNGNDSITVSGAITAAGTVSMSAGQTVLVNANVTAGAVTIAGGTGPAFVDSMGVVVNTGATVSATGAVSITGTGAGPTNARDGVRVQGTVTSTGGNVTIAGTGGSGAANSFNYGVSVSGTVSAGGTGTVQVTGQGGTTVGTGAVNAGVVVQGVGASITALNGPVIVQGTGGGNASSNGGNFGVVVQDAGAITSSGTGTVSVTGAGGAALATGGNTGVLVTNSGQITSGGGAVSVSGTGGTGGNSTNYGVWLLTQTTGGTINAPAALTVTGTRGAGAVEGILVGGAGNTISAGGLATLNGPSGGNVVVDAAATANFGSLVVTTTGSASITEDSSTLLATGTNVGGTFALTAVDGIAQTAAVTAGTLTAANSGTGSILLNGFANPITSFSASNTAAGGAVSVQLAAGATVTGITTSNGAVTVSNPAATAVTLAGNITTGGGAVSVSTNANPLVIGAAAVSINTGGGNLTIDRTTTSSADLTNVLTLNAGATGDISLGSVAVTPRLAGLVITNARNVTGGAVNVGASGITQAAGAGTTTLASLTVLGGGSISLTGTAFSLTGLSVSGTGTIDLTHSGTLAVSGNVSLGGSAGSALTVTSGGAGSIAGVISGGTAGGTTLTKLGAGTLTLGGVNTFVGAINVSGGTLRYSSGTATIGNAITIASGATLDGASGFAATLTFSGTILNNGAITRTQNGGSAFTNVISGTGTVSNGVAGNTTLSGNNTFSGGVTQAGDGTGANTLTLGNAGALGTGTFTIASSGAVQSSVANLVNANNNPILLNSNLTIGGSNNLNLGTGAVTLSGNRTITVSNSAVTLTLGGAVGETGGARSLSKSGAGTLHLTTASTYTGGTNLVTAAAGGTILASATNALGTGTVTIAYNTGATSAQLQLTGGITLPNAFSTTGVGSGGTGVIRSLAGTNTLSGVISLVGGGGNSNYQSDAGSTLVLSGTVGANAGLTRTMNLQGAGDFTVPALLRDRNSANPADTLAVNKAGAGTAVLSGANTYTQATTVAAGTLRLGSTAALGTTAGGTSVTAGAVLDLNGQTVGAEPLTLNGTGIAAAGALLNSSTTAASLAGDITLASASSVGGAGNITLGGTVSGGFGLTKVAATTLTLTGANTYSGTTTVSAGTLQLGNAAAGGSFGTGAVVNNAAVVFNRTDAYAVANAISGSGTVAQSGTGTTSLTAANTYTGTTNVTAGRLNVNGSVTSNVTVNGGVFGGTGTINSANTLTLNTGTVAPGTSTETLDSGSVTFTGGTFEVEVNGPAVGTQYDQLNVTGTVALGAGTTALSLPTPTFAAGNTYTIINNDGTDNVTGFFTGFPEGAEVASFGMTGKVYITYAGGDGNDVQLLTTPTVNGTTGDDIIIFRVALAPAGTYEVSIDNGATFANLGPITTVTINGQGGDDTLIIDAVNGDPFLAGGIFYNGGAHTSPNPGDVLQVLNGTYTTITHNFLTASSGNIDFDGRVVNYTGLEPVLVNVGTVTDVIFNLPAAASDAVLEDDGTPANGLSRLRSASGTFEVTTFNNPTGSATINRGNAADTLTVTALPDLTSSLTIGTVGSPFATLGVTGAVSLGTDKSFTSFGTTTTISAPVAVAGAGAVAITAGQSVSVTANVTGGTGGTTISGGTAPGAANTTGVTVSGGAVVTAAGAGAVAVTGTGGGNPASLGGNHGVSILGAGSQVTSGGGSVTVTGTGGTSGGGNFGVNMPDGGVITSGGDGTVTVTANAGTNTGAGAQRHGLFIRGGSDITSGGSGGVTVSGFGGLNSGSGSFGVNMLDPGTTITSGGGPVSVSGTGGTGAGGFNLGVVVDLGADILSGGDGNVSVTGTGGGAGALNWGVYTQGAGSTITAGGAGTVTVVGQGGTAGTGNDNHGVLVAQSSQITSGGGLVTVTGTGGGTGGGSANNLGVTVQTGGSIVAPNDLTVSGTTGANTATGISVVGAGQTISAGTLATLNGPSASDITIDSAATANFGNLTVSAAGATVTIFEDDGTLVNTITATTINLTSAGAITDNNGGSNNLTGTTATLAAAGGIDLDTTLGSLTATTSAAGAITIDELDAITLTNVTSADGNITITAGGTVSAVNVVDALDAVHVVSITTTAGDILVGNVVAAGDTVVLNAAGAILELGPADAAADITAHVITMTAVTGIGFTGTVEIDTITTAGRGLTASVTGTGLINLADTAGGLRVESATTANGSITITADAGDMIVETVTAGTLSAVNLSTTTSGSILDDDVDTTRVTGGVVTLTSTGSIGTGATAVSQLDTAATSITASGGMGAGVYLGELDDVTLTSVTTTWGPVIGVSGGTMTATSVSSGINSNVILAATGGDILLGTVTSDSNVYMGATGAIVDNNAGAMNVTGFALALRTATGVGSTDAIETTVSLLAGSNSTSGAFQIANTGSLGIGVVTFGGHPQVSIPLGAVGVTNTGGAIDISTGRATSDALLNVAQVVSGSGNVVLTSDQNYTQTPAVTSTGGSVTINADVVADADVDGAAVSINGPITAATTATINTGGDADTITVTRTSASIIDVFGGGIVAPAVGFDQVTVVLGALGTGFVRLNNSGNDNYRATVDGSAIATPLAFHANDVADQNGAAIPDAAGPRRVAVPLGTSTTVLDYRPAGATLNVLTLLGGTAADTYFVQFTDPAVVAPSPSLLPPLVNVNAAGAGDTANVYGTNAGDTIGINEASSDQVTSAGVVVQYDGNLETLNVFGKDEPNQTPPTPTFGDTFDLRPDTLTQINVSAGTPTLYPGDTLNLDVVPYVLNDPTFTPALPLPDGLIGFTGAGAAQTVTWTGIENFPVPLGMGGSFDFEVARNASRPFGYRSVIPSDNYAPAIGFGWDTPLPQYGIQAYDEGAGSVVGSGDTVFGPLTSPLGMLLRDFALGWQTPADYGIFRVAVVPNKPVQLTAYLGTATVVRDGQVVEWSSDGTNWVLVPSLVGVGSVTTQPGETTTAGGVVTPTGTSLYVRFRDITGEVYWSVAGLDVRPTTPGSPTGTGALVAPLPIRQEFSTATPLVAPPGPGVGFASGQAFSVVDADGVTVDYYRGKDAIPNSILTITVTNGTLVDALYTAADNALGTRVLNPDVAGYVRGFQVQADGNGEFTFGVRRPTGAATSTIQVTDATGFRADRFTQAFQLPASRRIDFGPLPAATLTTDYGNGGTVQSYPLPVPANAFPTGYLPFATAAYSAATGLGWAAGPQPLAFTPAGAGATALQRDGVFGGFAPSEFVLDVPGTNYVVTATLGDLTTRRDDMFVEVYNGSAWVFAKGYNPATGAYDIDLNGLAASPGTSPNAGQSMARTFLATASGGQVRVRFGNVTGNPNWSLTSLEVRPTQAAVTVALASPVPGGTTNAPSANGTDLTEYVISATGGDLLPAGTLFTIRPAVGQVTTADADPTTDGIQVAVAGDNTARFRVQAPTTAVTGSRIEVEEITGARRAVATQTYAPASPPPGVPAVRRFDFNGSTPGDTHPSMIGVRGTDLWTPGADYGWLTPVGEFERTTASLPASMTPEQKSLFRDGATLGGPAGTFRIRVPAAGTNYIVRFYIGDSFKNWPWIRVQVEGGAASGQLATSIKPYWSWFAVGNSGADDYLDVKVFGSSTWVLNGIDIAPGTTVSALPPSLLTSSPQLAEVTVAGGSAPKLTPAVLKPIVAEAVRRLEAAGADPARLAALAVSIEDLSETGRLGEHAPGTVVIDDDAGGLGWFVDATPADDAEFGAAVAVGLGATDPAAAKGVDLLTVVMHELSHELGFVDLSDRPADLMAESLPAGVRRLPAGAEPVLLPESKVELPAAPAVKPTTVTVEAPAAETVVMTPALWLVESDARLVPVAPTAADRVRVTAAAVEPVRVTATTTTRAAAPARSATPAWPDADALLDGVYVD